MLESRATFDNFTQFDRAGFTTGQGGGWEMQTNARFHLGWVAALSEKPNTDDRLRRQRKVVSGLFLKAVSVSAVLTYQRLRSHRI